MLEGKGRVYQTGNSVVIRIQKNLACDSMFPFKFGDLVKVKIEDDKVIISKKA